MEKNYTAMLSEYIAGIQYEQLPQEVLDQVKRLTLHVIGASIGALPIEQTQKTINMVYAKGGVGEATVWGSDGKKVPAREAAFANGAISDIMDWEDCHWTGHASAGAVPVALAMGEKLKLSGKDYMTAGVAGFEGYTRIAMAVQPSKEFLKVGSRWGLVSWQIFAASLAAAKAEKMNAHQIQQVLGASMYNAFAPCNRHSDGLGKSDIYHFSHGYCARNGVVAAEITKLGFDNCTTALDGPNGYWHKVSDQQDTSWYTKEFGTHWYICDTYLKHWPTNMWVQTPMEALDEIMKRRPFKLDEVEKIRISPIVPMICNDYSKSTLSPLDAQFSIPYCLTAYILDHTMSAKWFSKEMRHNETLMNASKLYEFFGPTKNPTDCFDEFKAGSFPEVTVEVYFKDGSCESKTMRYPKGHPLNNFTLPEQYDHFRLCCKPYMPAEQIEKIITMVDKLEEMDDVNKLAELCAIH